MNAHTNLSLGRMTSKGQVLIPKAIREAVGLVPGKPIRIGLNDRGEVVVLPHRAGRADETSEQRKARILEAIDALPRISVGQTTDEYMAEIRGPYHDVP